MAAMKNDGVPYEERIAKLEELEYPKPCRDFIYSTFNAFSDAHPWVGQENIRPKSIAREMFENFRELCRLHPRLRPPPCRGRAAAASFQHAQSAGADRAGQLQDRTCAGNGGLGLAGVLRGTDSSLLDEWEKLRDPNYKPDEVEEKPVEAPDITRNKREFTALIRTEIFRYIQQLIGDKIDLPELDDYYADHDRIRLDNEARNGRHTYVEPSDDGQTCV